MEVPYEVDIIMEWRNIRQDAHPNLSLFLLFLCILICYLTPQYLDMLPLPCRTIANNLSTYRHRDIFAEVNYHRLIAVIRNSSTFQPTILMTTISNVLYLSFISFQLFLRFRMRYNVNTQFVKQI